MTILGLNMQIMEHVVADFVVIMYNSRSYPFVQIKEQDARYVHFWFYSVKLVDDALCVMRSRLHENKCDY